jgi:hypothetical protein
LLLLCDSGKVIGGRTAMVWTDRALPPLEGDFGLDRRAAPDRGTVPDFDDQPCDLRSLKRTARRRRRRHRPDRTGAIVL